MKRRPTKADIRDEIEQQIREYLERGGEISEVSRGATGVTTGTFRGPGSSFSQPKSERTPIPEVMAAIDARRKAKTAPLKPKKPSKKPQKIPVYDDFGEPIRWVWKEQ